MTHISNGKTIHIFRLDMQIFTRLATLLPTIHITIVNQDVNHVKKIVDTVVDRGDYMLYPFQIVGRLFQEDQSLEIGFGITVVVVVVINSRSSFLVFSSFFLFFFGTILCGAVVEQVFCRGILNVVFIKRIYASPSKKYHVDSTLIQKSISFRMVLNDSDRMLVKSIGHFSLNLETFMSYVTNFVTFESQV